MAMINQEDINQIRSSVDIVDVIGSYLSLTQRGKNYFGVCPFHDDHSPSMSVSKEKQIYTCFSCGATGNVLNFIMDYEHISFIEAVKIAANKAGIALDIDVHSKNDQTGNKLYDIYDFSQKYFQNNLSSQIGSDAREYLRKRDVDEKTIKEFGIGLSLKEKDSLYNLLIKKNYDTKDLLKTGLINQKEYDYNDVYYNRIMFPLWDLFGRIVGYSGRIYNGEDTSKYINTKETEIFKKGELLYNYHRAKDAARQSQTIIIMEGFMAVIRAHISGIDNVVATMGTAVTKEQVALIKRLAKNVILCFDGDSAGAKATYACGNELIKVGVMPNVIILEEGLDPDDYIRKYGKEKFISKLDNPINIMDFKLNYLKEGKDITNSVELSEYVKEILNETNKIKDDVLQELTLQKLAFESHLDIDFLRKKLNPKVDLEVVVQPTNLKLDKYHKAERNLLYYMLHNTEVIKMYSKKVTCLPSEEGRELAKNITSFYKKYNEISVADLLSNLTENKKMVKLIGEIEALNLNEVYKIVEIDDYISVIHDYNVNFALTRLTEKLKNETDPAKKVSIGSEILKLRMGKDEND